MSDRLSFDDFSGGLWIPDQSGTLLEQAGFAVPQSALLQADNLDYLPSGAVRGRRGSSVYNAAALAGPVVALRRYYARPEVGANVSQFVNGHSSDQIGTSAWSTPEAGISPFDPGSARAIVLAGIVTEYLAGLTGFLFNPVPADATITGIEARVFGRCGTPAFAPLEHSIRLFTNYTVAGSNKSTGAALTTSNVLTTYGGAGDLWGLSLSPADVNNNGFGVGVSYIGDGGGNVCIVESLSLIVYFTSAQGNKFLAAHTSGASMVYSLGDAGSFTSLTTVADPVRRPRIVSWPQKGKLFLFDGVNETRAFDGAAISVVPAMTDETGELVGIAVPKGPYACLHKNRLMATDPGELAFSVYGSDINNEQSWRGALQLSVNDSRGGRLTGLESFGDALLIFKDTALFRFLGDLEFGGGQLTEISSNGCVAPDSVAVTPYGVIYVGREGVWLTNGSDTILLSAAIRALFVERTAQQVYSGAVGVFYPRRDQYRVCLDPTAESPETWTLTRLAIPTEDGERTALCWARIPGVAINCGTVWDGAGDEGELYIGDPDGVVWLHDVGAADNGVAYTTALLTMQRLVDRARLEGRANRVRPLYRGAEILTGALRYDQVVSDSVALSMGAATGGGAALQEPRVYVTDKVQFGRFVSFRCESTEGPEFELHRVDLDMRSRGPRGWR